MHTEQNERWEHLKRDTKIWQSTLRGDRGELCGRVAILRSVSCVLTAVSWGSASTSLAVLLWAAIIQRYTYLHGSPWLDSKLTY